MVGGLLEYQEKKLGEGGSVMIVSTVKKSTNSPTSPLSLSLSLSLPHSLSIPLLQAIP